MSLCGGLFFFAIGAGVNFWEAVKSVNNVTSSLTVSRVSAMSNRMFSTVKDKLCICDFRSFTLFSPIEDGKEYGGEVSSNLLMLANVL